MSFRIFISSVQKEFAKERKWLADYGHNALNKGLPSRTNDRVNDRVNDRANEGVNEDVTKNLSDKERLVYALIKKNPDITNRVLISKTNFAHATIERAVKRLKEKSLIERIGSDKTGHWKVKH